MFRPNFDGIQSAEYKKSFIKHICLKKKYISQNFTRVAYDLFITRGSFEMIHTASI